AVERELEAEQRIDTARSELEIGNGDLIVGETRMTGEVELALEARGDGTRRVRDAADHELDHQDLVGGVDLRLLQIEMRTFGRDVEESLHRRIHGPGELGVLRSDGYDPREGAARNRGHVREQWKRRRGGTRLRAGHRDRREHNDPEVFLQTAREDGRPGFD